MKVKIKIDWIKFLMIICTVIGTGLFVSSLLFAVMYSPWFLFGTLVAAIVLGFAVSIED